MRFSGVQRRAPGGDTRAILYGRERSGWGPGAQRSLRLALIGAVLVLTSGGIGAGSYVEAKHGGRYTAMQLFPGRVAWVDLESNAAIRPGLPGGLLDWSLLALDSGVELHDRGGIFQGVSGMIARRFVELVVRQVVGPLQALP